MKPKVLTGIKKVAEFPEGETVVNIQEFKGGMFIATNKRVYEMVADKIAPLEIEEILEPLLYIRCTRCQASNPQKRSICMKCGYVLC